MCTHFWPTLRPWLDALDDGGSERSSSGGTDGSWYQMIGTDMDALIAECGPKFWVCGHAHETKDVTIGETRISSNPRAGDGPGHINPEFVESYVLEV